MSELEEATMRARIVSLEVALKVIYTWAGVSGGLVPTHVRELIETRMPFSAVPGQAPSKVIANPRANGTLDLRKVKSLNAMSQALKGLAEQHVAVLTTDSHVRVTVHRGCAYINIDGYNVFSVEAASVHVDVTSKAAT